MKVLFVPDVPDWAIGHLVEAKVKNLPQHKTRIIPVHPRNATEQAESFMLEVEGFKPDLIIYEYFRSAEQLINQQPNLKKYKSVLVHHNQRDAALFHADWNELGIDTIVTHTNKCREKLEAKGYTNVRTINHGIDLDFFEYSGEEPEEPCVGYVGRIVPWKGLKEIAEVCAELEYPVEVMGKPDKPDYWNSIPKENLRFSFFECLDSERPEAYHNMTIYVGNSEDNYEEGTLPFLEALACGVPVVTTPNGVAADIIKDGENGLLVPFGDKEALKTAISGLMEDTELRKRLREGGWNTVRQMSEEKMAYEYAELINELLTTKELVSVVIPATFDRAIEVEEILTALENQSYGVQHIEAIVVWDDLLENAPTGLQLRMAGYRDRLTLREIITNEDGYNLAKARNLGAIESMGDYLMFCDSRMQPAEDAIDMFVEAIRQVGTKNIWLFGDKGANKNSFVENFSFIRRDNFFKFGMMCERIDRYGGMSQEIRTRFVEQGGELSYLPMAQATPMKGSKMTPQKRKDIAKMKFKLLKMYKGKSH